MLPLDKEKIHTIGVIGPNADNRMALVGNYEGTAPEALEALPVPTHAFYRRVCRKL